MKMAAREQCPRKNAVKGTAPCENGCEGIVTLGTNGIRLDLLLNSIFVGNSLCLV